MSRSRPRPGWLPPLGFLAVALALLAGSIVWAAWRNTRVRELDYAEGRVVEHVRRARSTYYVVEFVPAGRATPVRVESSVGDIMVYGIGSTVGVYYDGDDPTDAILDSGSELYFVPSVIAGGATCCGVPAGVFWLAVVGLLRKRSA